MTVLASRFAAALRRRTYPNTGVRAKTLAHAAGVSTDTFDRYVAGSTRITAEAVFNLAAFFAKSGDHGFVGEVYGIEASGVCGQPIAASSNVTQLRPHDDQIFWCDDSGNLHHAAHGSAEFIRRAVGETATERFAHRMLGWVSLTLRPDFTAELRYTEGQANQAAVSRACAFLVDEGRKTLRTVRRVVDCAGEWVAAIPASPEEAANALALSAKLPTPYLVVHQLALDVANNVPEFRAILAESSDEPGSAWAASLRNMAGRASYLNVIGEDVTLPILAGQLGLPDDWAGKNIMAIPTLRFADMTRHWMQIARSGPVLRRVQAPIGNDQVDYLNLAMPDGPLGKNGGVVSATKVLKRERIAA